MISLINRRSFGPGLRPIDTYIGLTTDSKPTDCGNGSRFYNMDLGKWSYFNEENGLWITEAETYLAKIEVATPPTTTAYTAGETFDDTGMVVDATDTAGTKTEGVEFKYQPEGPLSEADTTIDVYYTVNGVTKHTTQAITVSEATK